MCVCVCVCVCACAHLLTLTLSHYIYTGPTSLSTDPITPGAWQGSDWSTDFQSPNYGESGNPTQACGLSSRAPSCWAIVCLLVGCLMSQQHASVSQEQICSDKFTSCHTEIEVADQTFHLTQSQYTDTGPTSASTDPTTPGALQGSHWSANF